MAMIEQRFSYLPNRPCSLVCTYIARFVIHLYICAADLGRVLIYDYNHTVKLFLSAHLIRNRQFKRELPCTYEARRILKRVRARTVALFAPN